MRINIRITRNCLGGCFISGERLIMRDKELFRSIELVKEKVKQFVNDGRLPDDTEFTFEKGCLAPCLVEVTYEQKDRDFFMEKVPSFFNPEYHCTARSICAWLTPMLNRLVFECQEQAIEESDSLEYEKEG
jgi:hypothetical protein